MEKKIVLITGGARSGKSRYAEELASAVGTRLLYVATAEAKDEEMTQRIAEHRGRRGSNWTTIEEPIEVTRELLGQLGAVDCAVVDCLTFWISNLLLQQGEEGVKEEVDGLVEQLPRLDFHIVLVTNEVGSAVVPDNPLARKFRDLVGWTNQRVAETADEVLLMVAGLPMIVKKGRACS
jgi:adenosylcobinamide kinase / adenosylcobinamide-phosphate guanylyltransferase